jgi:hypothetical protein
MRVRSTIKSPVVTTALCFSAQTLGMVRTYSSQWEKNTSTASQKKYLETSNSILAIPSPMRNLRMVNAFALHPTWVKTASHVLLDTMLFLLSMKKTGNTPSAKQLILMKSNAMDSESTSTKNVSATLCTQDLTVRNVKTQILTTLIALETQELRLTPVRNSEAIWKGGVKNIQMAGQKRFHSLSRIANQQISLKT